MAEQEPKKSKNPIHFLKDVSTEMKRVTWPTRPELFRYTVIVSTTVIFMAIFFAISDLGISSLLELITN
ncbi:preprotein translocase subunit SecE [Salisediminibacterium beveridgei]|uniref:Protein translocase subunit SecE n=1 Tax=Salisediminibacterium beveridgei TaxID=632773 RepID=A0A1D7QZY7_9BACI|nr:preprotein translocase subunit SecE [Salisediminibacterium beveridgei]AOM84576.1 Preprotein translocase subunit SecE [Salisediminibacterium beveridgei]